MDDANDYVEKAETHLRNAQEIHKKTRSRMCCVLFCITLFLVPAVLWLLGIF